MCVLLSINMAGKVILLLVDDYKKKLTVNANNIEELRLELDATKLGISTFDPCHARFQVRTIYC